MSEYGVKTVGHILRSLRDLGIPVTTTDSVIVGAGIIMLHDKPFALYKYFDGIEQPLFDFEDKSYHAHRHLINGDTLKSKFHLSLTHHRTAGLVVSGWDATHSLREFLNSMFTNDIRDPCYTLRQNSGAFFQAGISLVRDSESGYIFIEFSKPSGAQAFIDHLNSVFVRKI
jgi:hypothetical protein